MIVHITTYIEWEKAQLEGAYLAPSLNTEGFIHCSSPNQIIDTANLFFKGQHGLVLLCIDETKSTSQCKYEPAAAKGMHDPSLGKLFPHVYGPINLSAVNKVVDFPPDENGLFSLPKDIVPYLL